MIYTCLGCSDVNSWKKIAMNPAMLGPNDSLDFCSLVEITLLLDRRKIEIRRRQSIRAQQTFSLPTIPKFANFFKIWETKEREKKNGTKIRPKIIQQIIVNDRLKNILERSSCSIERSLARILNWKKLLSDL